MASCPHGQVPAPTSSPWVTAAKVILIEKPKAWKAPMQLQDQISWLMGTWQRNLFPGWEQKPPPNPRFKRLWSSLDFSEIIII